MAIGFGPRRGVYVDIAETIAQEGAPLTDPEVAQLETLDRVYRALCALMFNYVPQSGHPGGSVSSGRIVAALVFHAMDYELADPGRDDADILSYAAGHKALGLYAMWALRNEIARLAAPELLPADAREQLRLEDLLGFRRNPVTATPLFKRFNVKPLDGHPTPATPFVRLSTGASGVGLAASLGLALAAADYYGQAAPRVHIVEGEGGLTPGRASEALAAAGSASLSNAILHVDWNQASIDTNAVCREGETPGDYVQWTPMELLYLNDWNVIFVPDGFDPQQIASAQLSAARLDTGQPTAIVYRTVKGWRYGIEGRASHGAGHSLCSPEFFKAIAAIAEDARPPLPRCEADDRRCGGGTSPEAVEECYWTALQAVRAALSAPAVAAQVGALAERLRKARARLTDAARQPRPGAPEIARIYTAATQAGAVDRPPPALALAPGTQATLRGELGRVLHHYNTLSGGAVFSAAADLLGSTSANLIGEGFGSGYFNVKTNPETRLLSVGGICEDATAGLLSGIAAFGRHTGATSSYGAFNAALGHVAARLHAIGNQASAAQAHHPGSNGAAPGYRPFFLVCAHAGLKTGEDGPTHADPQALQLLQENFPRGTAITLTPWDPQEVWTLVTAALAQRPAVISPFVTRPVETVIDRAKLRLAPASAAASGLYRLREAKGERAGTVVLQGSGVTYAFVQDALPRLDAQGVELDVLYVASAELFDALPAEERERIFPEAQAQEALGITGFTLPTMYRWIGSEFGRQMTLHPFRDGHFLGSGQAHMVLAEAGLDGPSQFEAIMRYLSERPT